MNWPRLRRDQYLSGVLICGMFLLGAGAPQPLEQAVVEVPQLQLLTAAPIPVKRTQQVSATLSGKLTEPVISAEAALVIDIPSASILYEKNARSYLHPASTAKLMTALIASGSYDPQQRFTVNEEAKTVGTVVGFVPGTVLTLNDVLKAALIQSGNDAAFLLANNYPGGYEAFVEKMNDKAQELHLEQTTFTNPSGLDTEAQLTTAFDLSLLTREVLKQQTLAEIVATPTTIVKDESGVEYQLYNTNRLLHQDSRYQGVKTGTTTSAGEVLISRYRTEERDIVVVVMQSRDRYTDTDNLMDWVTTHYDWLTPVTP